MDIDTAIVSTLKTAEDRLFFAERAENTDAIARLIAKAQAYTALAQVYELDRIANALERLTQSATP